MSDRTDLITKEDSVRFDEIHDAVSHDETFDEMIETLRLGLRPR